MRPSRSSRSALLVLISCVVLAAAFALWSRRAQPVGDPPRSAAPGPRAEARATFSAPPSLPAGDVSGRITAYDLALTSEADLNLGALGLAGSDPTRVESAVKGSLEQIVLIEDDTGSLELLRVRGAAATRTGGPPPTGDTPATAAALERGVVVHRARDGHVERIRLPRAIDPDADGMARQLAEQLQVGVAPGPDTDEWTATEAGVLGALAVRYTRSRDGASGELRRVIEGVDATSGVGGDGSVQIAIAFEGGHTIGFDDGVETLEGGSRMVATRVTDGAPAVTSEIRVSARRTGRRIDVALATELLRELDRHYGPWTRLDQASPPPLAAPRAELIAGRDLDGLLRDLRGDVGSDSEALRSLTALVAFLQLHPDQVTAVAAALRDLTVDDPLARNLVLALAQLGDDAAQAALITVARAWQARDDGSAASLMTVLGGQAHPSADTERFLRETSRAWATSPELASSASLAYGNVARRVADSDPERARVIVDELVATLATPQSAGQRGTYLASLGNTGAASAIATVASHLDDDDVFVRETAARVLGKADSDQVDALLAARVRIEEHEAVLGHLVATIVERRPAAVTIDAMAARLSRGAGSLVASLVEAIGRGLDLTPSARAALAPIARGDDEVAARARALLDG